MVSAETKNKIDEYKKAKSDFSDYTYFEVEESERKSQQELFLKGSEYTPHYEYPRLDGLRYDHELQSKKSSVYEAVLELEAAKEEYGEDSPELEIYADYYELRLKRIMLVEAARDLYQVHDSSEWEVAEHAFMNLNREVYGEFDIPRYRSMITTEYDKVESFSAKSDEARSIKQDLLTCFGGIKSDQEREKPLLNDENLAKLHDAVIDRYSSILDSIPNTDDSIFYDADQCAQIINNTLSVSGLAKLGWDCEVNPSKTGVSTDTPKCHIFLPSNTRRNSNELKRLVIHEQEVHARRAENGKKTGFKPLALGTADFTDVEEGLAVMLECAVAGTLDNASFNRVRDRYITAGLALGVDGVSPPCNARQVHDVLWRMIAIRNSSDGEISNGDIEKAKKDAYVHVENAFRGTEFWMSGVIYTKLKVYYEGLEKNARFLAENIDNINGTLDAVMIGKYNHTSEHEREVIASILENKQKYDEQI